MDFWRGNLTIIAEQRWILSLPLIVFQLKVIK